MLLRILKLLHPSDYALPSGFQWKIYAQGGDREAILFERDFGTLKNFVFIYFLYEVWEQDTHISYGSVLFFISN